jgi:hypothetical protein
MTKFLIGVATAALWFALSHAAKAERICREVCDHGTCVSRCVHRPDADVIATASIGGIATAALTSMRPRAAS